MSPIESTCREWIYMLGAGLPLLAAVASGESWFAYLFLAEGIAFSLANQHLVSHLESCSLTADSGGDT